MAPATTWILALFLLAAPVTVPVRDCPGPGTQVRASDQSLPPLSARTRAAMTAHTVSPDPGRQLPEGGGLGLLLAASLGAAAGPRPRRRVLIVQAVLKHYRQPVFERMEATLAAHGVQLQVAFSSPNPLEALRQDNAEDGGSYGIKVPAYWFFGTHVLYQRIIRLAMRADLVVVEQANKYVWNYLLLLLSRLSLKRVAYWGHGRDRRAPQDSFRERLKARLARWSSWWFPYTEGCGTELAALGVDTTRMTVLQNAVDTRQMREDARSITAAEREAFRASLGIGPDDRVAVFCGSLYVAKSLDFLLDAAARLARCVPGFRLLILGDGPDRTLVEAALPQSPWLRYLGPRFGRDKVLAFCASELVLNPGLVGLGILDAFAAGRPFIAGEYPYHSPEVDYLVHGSNGLMLPLQAEPFVAAVRDLLADPARLASMSARALADSHTYTAEAMADRFVAGILAALAQTSALGSPALDLSTPVAAGVDTRA